MRTLLPLGASEIQRKLKRLQGRSAAVVYSFQPEHTPQKIWYDQWRSDVISFYGTCLEVFGLHPYFVDVTTFCRQALARELPDLVCAFNLNAGVTPITHWAVMPSVSFWAGVEPLPARADVLIVGERKDTASLIARDTGLQVPRIFREGDLDSLPEDSLLLIKPRDLGGSVGIRVIRKGHYDPSEQNPHEPYLIQEFIAGYDLTVPIIYRPSTGTHIAPAGTLYLPSNPKDTIWIHGENSKRERKGYTKKVVSIPAPLQELLIKAAAQMELGPYARFDLRVGHLASDDLDAVKLSDVWFLEVNPLPTLRKNVNLIDAVSSPIFREAVSNDIEAMVSICSASPSEIAEAFPIACSLLSLSI